MFILPIYFFLPLRPSRTNLRVLEINDEANLFLTVVCRIKWLMIKFYFGLIVVKEEYVCTSKQKSVTNITSSSNDYNCAASKRK
jgi:hypothetical protein